MARSTPLTPQAAAIRVIEKLRTAGHEALLAGGCVRDVLLGLEPKDYDVATDARPERVLELYPRGRGVGAAFGVVLVRVGGQAIEVATFREDATYSDGRRPDAVTFSDARHDARRRDFTLNGLFADPLEPERGSGPSIPGVGRIIDFVGGVADLRAGVIRAIGEADERLGEDFLRMLRAVRFAARLGFELDPETARAIQRHAPRLADISRERIGQEVQRMLGIHDTSATPSHSNHPGTDPRARAAQLLQTLGLDAPTLDEPSSSRAATTLARLDIEASYPAALAAWAVDRHAAQRSLRSAAAWVRKDGRELTRRWRAALCLSNEQSDELNGVLAVIDRAADWPTLGVAARKRLLADPHWDQAWRVMRAMQQDELIQAINTDTTELRGGPGVAPPPLVDGSDLIAAGLTPGPAFGPLLRHIYDAQLEGRVTTRDQAMALVAAGAMTSTPTALK